MGYASYVASMGYEGGAVDAAEDALAGRLLPMRTPFGLTVGEKVCWASNSLGRLTGVVVMDWEFPVGPMKGERCAVVAYWRDGKAATVILPVAALERTPPC